MDDFFTYNFDSFENRIKYGNNYLKASNSYMFWHQ